MEKPRRYRITLAGLLVAIALIAGGLAWFRPLRETEITDVKVGTGATVKAGDTVAVHYAGKLANGTVFDDSKAQGQPAEFPIGRNMVIKGWDIGLIGMRVGGVRQLAIPPQEGYGEKGVPPVIPPHANLYFDVELIGIR